MQNPYGIYLVFNPLINKQGNYATQAHEFYYALKGQIQKNDDCNFMYWGKLSVNSDSSKLYKSLEASIEMNKKNGRVTYLYISDYHHFWVAKVDSVHKEIFNHNLTIPFYDDKDVDLWFKITDMDLVSKEFEETSFYLSQLYCDNQFSSQKIDSINPYIGGVQFPLIVQSHHNENHFFRMGETYSHRVLMENPLIENPSYSLDITEKVKSFVLPNHIFGRLDHPTKMEIINTELKISKSHHDKKLQESVLQSYIKIFTSVLNRTIGDVLRCELGDKVFLSENGNMIDYQAQNSLKLSQFNKDFELKQFMNLKHDFEKFGNSSLHSFFEKYSKLVDLYENEILDFAFKFEILAKEHQIQNGNLNISKEEVFAIRNQILGVGCIGVINSLVQEKISIENTNYFFQNAG